MWIISYLQLPNLPFYVKNRKNGPSRKKLGLGVGSLQGPLGKKNWLWDRKKRASEIQGFMSGFSDHDRFLAVTMLKLKIHESDGQAFEDLFVRVMTLSGSDFRPVKAQGKKGDKKNDGFCDKSGRFFQVYGPEKHEKDGPTKAVKKIEEDFDGLKAAWDSSFKIREYYFVLNDKFKGTYSDVELCLRRIKVDHELEECRPWLAQHIVETFRGLDKARAMEIIGSIPKSDSTPDIDFLALKKVLSHLVSTSTPLPGPENLTVPDFDEKLEFNGLNGAIGLLLRGGALQCGAIESYFQEAGGESKRIVRDKLASIYSNLPQSLEADVSFFKLLEEVVGKKPSQATQTAGISLIAYFFEACDVYKEPSLPL